MAEKKMPKLKKIATSKFNIDANDVATWKMPEGCYDEDTEGYSLRKIIEYLGDEENGMKIEKMQEANAWIWYFLSAGLYKYVGVSFCYVHSSYSPICWTQNYECNPTSAKKYKVTYGANVQSTSFQPILWNWEKPQIDEKTLEPMAPLVGECNDNKTLQAWMTIEKNAKFDFHGVCDYKVNFATPNDGGTNKFIGASSKDGDCLCVLYCANGWLIFNWADSKYKGTRRNAAELKGGMSGIIALLEKLKGEENNAFIQFVGGEECSFKFEE